MKIFHVVYDFTPGDYRGGIPKIVYELAVQQAKSGHQVTVFTPHVRQEFASSTSLPDGIVVQTLQTMGNSSVLQCIKELAAQHDIVHSHNTFHLLNKYVASASRETHIPAVFNVQGALDPVVVNKGFVKSIKKHFYIRLVERKSLNSASAIFALTEQEKHQIEYWGINTPIHVVPNGIKFLESPKPENVEKFRDSYPTVRDAQVIAYVGRINPKKGIDILIDSFARIAKEFPKAILVLAGDLYEVPSYVTQLEAQIEKMGLQKRVIWTGFLNEVEKLNVFSIADVFSHVTASEGMAISVLEAMAFGVPTIVSPGCYMDDAVKQKAVLLSNYDVDSLSTQLSNLLNDPELREDLRKNGQKHIAAHHDWSVIAEQINKVYEDIIAQKNRKKERALSDVGTG